MLSMAARGEAHEGDWLIAERQTAGRGRSGREWSSPTGNLFATGLVALRPNDPPAPSLALLAGLALHLTLDLPRASLKWPNDLTVAGSKLAGILLERNGNHVVVGVGVNVAHAPDIPGRATTNLFALGVDVTPNRIVNLLAETFSAWRRTWRAEGVSSITGWWLDRAHPIGTALSAELPDGSQVNGSFGGLADNGALILRLADGSVRVIHAGDVFLI